MSTSKYVDKICIAAISLMLVVTILFMFGEKLGITVVYCEEDENTSQMFTANDLNADWDRSGATEIFLNGDSAKIKGTGAYFSNDILHIVYAGKYKFSGTLNGSVQIEADGDDKIWLLFDGVNITSKTDAPLDIRQADKVFLTLEENSQNMLTFDNNDEDSETDGSIFSRDDLTINGKGDLTIVSSGLHGIVCNDSLVFSGGNINITAKNDGVHAHDAIKICDATLTVSAGDDGLHVGNDDENAIFYLESGCINITECYEGIEANEITIAGGTVNITPSDDGINASGRGDVASITISGGDVTVINKNGRDADGLDSNGSINITGGNIFISVSGNGTNNAIDFGSENGGKCIIMGGNIIACGSSQMAEAPDNDSTQGFIMQTVRGNENDILSVLDSGGEEIISKEIPCSFTSVIISSPEISVGDTVKLKVGDTETDITVSNVTENRMGAFGNPGGQEGVPPERPDEGMQNNGMPGGQEGIPPERPDETMWNNGMPEDQNGIPREMSDENHRGDMQRPGENGSNAFEVPVNDDPNQNDDYNGSRNNERGQNPMSNIKMDNLDDKLPISDKGPDEQNVNSSSAWILLGVSTLILIVGIIIAIKKKY